MKLRGIVAVVAIALSAGVFAGMTGLLPGVLRSAGFADGVGVPGIINHQGVVAVNGTRFNGTGTFRFAVVDAASEVNLWTNDNTQLGTSNAPAGGVTLAVADGIYSVPLGQDMTAFNPSVFANSNTALRVWFDDGTHGNQQLSPDQKLTSVPYAMAIADGAVSSAKLASKAVGTEQLADGAVTAEQVAAGAIGTNHLAAGAITNATLSPDLDGWIPAGETWSYASATTFRIGGDKTGKYQKGDKIKLTQSTVKYFYIIGVSFASEQTTVTVTAGTDYTLSNAAIAAPAFSRAVNPFGFPEWFNYSPTITWTATTRIPSGTVGSQSRCRFRIAGHTVNVNLAIFDYPVHGLGVTAVEATLPFVIATQFWSGYGGPALGSGYGGGQVVVTNTKMQAFINPPGWEIDRLVMGAEYGF